VRIPYPYTFDDVTRGLNFSFPPKDFRVVHTSSAVAFITMDLDGIEGSMVLVHQRCF